MKTDRMQSVRSKDRWLPYAVGVLALTPAQLILAEGFRNPPPGAFNLGRAGGRFAHIDDSSAVQQNPANLVDISQREFQVAPSVVYMSVEHESPGGQKAETENPWKVLPNFFGSMPLADQKFAIGLGITVPYGLSVEWRNQGAFADPTALRYQAPHYNELKTINVNPTAAMRINDKLQVGAGFDVMWSEVIFKQFYPWMIFPGSTGTEPDGTADARGTGFGFGGNIGLTWQIAENHRLAVTYRSPMNVDYDGDFDIDNVTPTAASIGVTSHSDFSTEIRFPTIVGAGYGIKINDNLRLEIDAEWIQFSRFEKLELDVDNNGVLFPSTTFRHDWDDTFTAGIGGDWKISPDWILRAGYQFYESPVPDRTLSTSIPDANQHVFTVGLNYHHGNHELEVAYGLDLYDKRTIDNAANPVFNGEYDFTVHLFALSYRFRF